ncbi:MAG: hypothetical protein SF051_16570, partial [Elusimicrobiota bacterium]|nr:hypothetical protein [Elusimicrobiota bacterium]
MKTRTRFVLSALLSLSVVVAPWPAAAAVARVAAPVAPVVGRVPAFSLGAGARVEPTALSAPAASLAAPFAPAALITSPADAPRAADAPARAA